MKNSPLIILCFLLLSCTHKDGIIVVQYKDATGIELLSSAIFKNIEVITLHREDAPLFDPTFVDMVVKNDTYYISDPYGSQKIYLFNANGAYLNSVGEIGRGPAEYLALSDMIIEDNGDISVYSCLQGISFTYSPQGRFLGSTLYPYRARNFAKANGLNYLHFGDGGGMPYQLYITDSNNHVVDSCWKSREIPSAVPFVPFTWYKDTLYLCPSYGGEIYRFVDGKPKVSYSFDFGVYTIPPEYFTKNPQEGLAFIMTKTVALKDLFFENQKCAILLADVRFNGQGVSRDIYGLLEKATSTWKWYYINQGDFMNNHNLKYMDDSYLYFMVDPSMIKEQELIDKWPILLDNPEGIIILKCQLAT